MKTNLTDFGLQRRSRWVQPVGATALSNVSAGIRRTYLMPFPTVVVPGRKTFLWIAPVSRPEARESGMRVNIPIVHCFAIPCRAVDALSETDGAALGCPKHRSLSRGGSDLRSHS